MNTYITLRCVLTSHLAGVSVCHEAIATRHVDMKVLAVSVVSNK